MSVEGKLLLEQMGLPVGGSYCDVEVITSRGVTADTWRGRYIARMQPLTAVLDVDVNTAAMMRAKNTGSDLEGWVRAFVDEKLRPFQEKLDRAARAAAEAWEKEMAT